MNMPQVNKLSRASQLSLVAVVILLGAVFVTVNGALQQQKDASHASSSTPTITYIQSNFQKSYYNQTSVTLNSPVTAGNFLVVAVSNYVGTVASISDNRGDTFHVAKQQPTTANTPVGQISIYYVPSAVGGSTTITAKSTAPTSQTSVSLEAVEYNGVNAVNPLDQVAGGSGTSSAINSGNTGTTTQANELVVGAGTFTNNAPYTINAGSGFTYRAGNTDGTDYNPPVFIEDKNVYSTGAYNAPFSSSNSVTWQGAVATFRAAAAPTVMQQPTLAAPTATPTPTPFSPTATPVPTSGVGPTDTPTPTVIAATPLPTSTPVPGDTYLAVTVGLQGIGTAGDSADPNSDGNMNPLRPTRTVTAEIYDASNQLVLSQQGAVTYDTSSGKFIGTVDLGQNFATGLYTVKIKTDQFLRVLVPGIQTITTGQTTTLSAVTLVAGDIDGDNQINIVDYNILLGCYSDLLPATNCNATNNTLSDLNDDGAVNQFDYNLFLRELSNVGGE
jgi:hypothetical protein